MPVAAPEPGRRPGGIQGAGLCAEPYATGGPGAAVDFLVEAAAVVAVIRSVGLSLLRFDAAHSRGATEEILVVRCPQPVTNERVPHTSAIPELLRVDAQHTVIFGVAQRDPR